MYAKSATDRRDIERSHRRRSRCTVSCGPYTSHGAPVHGAPFILYFASAKYRLTVTPSNEIKDTSFPPPFLAPSFSSFRRRGRESRVRLRGSCCHLAYYSTPLSSLADELPGLFFLREPLPALRELCFSFLSLPRPASTVAPRGSSAASFFLFPFSCCSTPGPGHGGIMQHITEKSKQARRNTSGIGPAGSARASRSALIRVSPVARSDRGMSGRADSCRCFIKLRQASHAIIDLNLLRNKGIEELSPAQKVINHSCLDR